MSSDKCFPCDKDFKDSTLKVAKEKEIETFCNVSKKRKDGKGAVLANKKRH